MSSTHISKPAPRVFLDIGDGMKVRFDLTTWEQLKPNDKIVVPNCEEGTFLGRPKFYNGDRSLHPYIMYDPPHIPRV
jgi:hypothetical protein